MRETSLFINRYYFLQLLMKRVNITGDQHKYFAIDVNSYFDKKNRLFVANLFLFFSNKVQF